MSLLTIYLVVAVVVLSVVYACYGTGVRRDPSRLVAIVAAAALWPIVAVGLIQFGAIQPLATFLRHHAPAPAMAAPMTGEPDPGSDPAHLNTTLHLG